MKNIVIGNSSNHKNALNFGYSTPSEVLASVFFSEYHEGYPAFRMYKRECMEVFKGMQNKKFFFVHHLGRGKTEVKHYFYNKKGIKRLILREIELNNVRDKFTILYDGEVSGCRDMGSCQCGDVAWSVWWEKDGDKIYFNYQNSNWSKRKYDYIIPYVGCAKQIAEEHSNVKDLEFHYNKNLEKS